MSSPAVQTDARRRGLQDLTSLQADHICRVYCAIRIQGLLSPQQNGAVLVHHNELDGSPRHNSTSPRHGKKLDPKFLKIRVVTWNMHDSLPKGDLQDLLGRVPHYDASSAKLGQFPRLANDNNHPFHIVVVAGQECPTPSGLPMGLGAGFKIGEKDREKSKNGIHDDRTDTDTSEKEKREEIRDTNAHEKVLSGWTQLVEDWLCNGIGSKTGSPSSAQIGTPKPLIRKKSCREPRRGPYQLLIKDRLMGIYLALYIHRDLKPLVQGMSKSSVTAGLIGGRLGNKGGVGISLRLDGTTFLFLNAHLAAHEGKVHHRLGNLSKIKTELDVDTFLASDDARVIAEDLTDKFDFTFLFGDLNFRLDISRLHADWLISREEYAQAFEFDQLNVIMKKGSVFDAFHEAPINFPPTFKYDVSRPAKRRRRSRSQGQSPFPQPDERPHEMVEEEVDEGTDVISVTSSVTSVNSRVLSEAGAVDDYFRAVPSNSTLASSSSKNLDNVKGKPKWLSLLSPSFATSPKFSILQQGEPSQLDPTTPTTPNTASSISPPSPTTPRTANPGKKRFLRPPPMNLTNFSVSQSSIQDESAGEERGVYDTSSKKRVPSWCDRILWKTTIPKLPSYAESLDDFSPQSRRTTRRVSQFFQALRSPSSRSATLEANGRWTPGPSSDQTPSIEPSSPIIASDVIQMNPVLSANVLNFKYSGHPGSRRTSSGLSPPPTAPLPSQISPRRPTMGNTEQPRSASGSIWRFLPAFLSPNSNPTNVTPEEVQAFSSPSYVRGDIVCLSYGTLDDKEMKRLEGRSDHRPVIGAYAVYL